MTPEEKIAKMRAALERIAYPNNSVRATAQDARDMAAFARETLAEIDEGERDD